MATAFVAHEQTKKNPDTGERYVIYDTGAADEYGVRQVVFKHEAHYLTPSEQIQIARAALSNATPEDWLVFCGAPDLCVIAALVMAEVTDGVVNLLMYDRDDRRYLPRRLDLHPNHPNRK